MRLLLLAWLALGMTACAPRWVVTPEWSIERDNVARLLEGRQGSFGRTLEPEQVLRKSQAATVRIEVREPVLRTPGEYADLVADDLIEAIAHVPNPWHVVDLAWAVTFGFLNLGSLAGPASVGSGICLGDGSYVLTAAHVVDRRGVILIHSAEKAPGQQVPATLLCVNRMLDFALLRLEVPWERGVNPTGGPVEIGRKVFVSGYPALFAPTARDLRSPLFTFGEGRIISVTASPGIFLIDAPVAPGCSGGGVFTEEGALVGIVTHVTHQVVVARSVEAIRTELRDLVRSSLESIHE